MHTMRTMRTMPWKMGADGRQHMQPPTDAHSPVKCQKNEVFLSMPIQLHQCHASMRVRVRVRTYASVSRRVSVPSSIGFLVPA